MFAGGGLPAWAPWCMVGFWAAASALDIAHTARHGRFVARHERSPLLRFLAARRPLGQAVVLTLCTECVLILAAPYLLTRGFYDVPLLGWVCLLAGIIHVLGYVESRRFVQGRAGRPSTLEDGSQNTLSA